MPATEANARYGWVQSLRFVAALLVVGTHATLYTSERLDPSLPVWHFGEMGVDVFFVISGFVMAVSAAPLVDRADGWRRFGMRRLVRIVPIYWIATTVKLLTVVAIPALALHVHVRLLNTILSYLFLPSISSEGKIEPLLGVGWTLTFEMFFYAIFALALLLRVNVLYFCGAILTALAVGSVFRDGDWPAVSVYLDPRVLYFLGGIIIGRYVLDRSRVRCAVGLTYVFVLFTAVRLTGGEFNWWQDIGRHGVALAAVLLAVLAEPRFGPRVPRPALFLGNASYSLYLFHPLAIPAVPVALAILGLPIPALSIVLCLAGAIVVAAAVFQWVERPVTAALQARVPYAGRTPLEATTPVVSDVTVAP